NCINNRIAPTQAASHGYRNSPSSGLRRAESPDVEPEFNANSQPQDILNYARELELQLNQSNQAMTSMRRKLVDVEHEDESQDSNKRPRLSPAEEDEEDDEDETPSEQVTREGEEAALAGKHFLLCYSPFLRHTHRVFSQFTYDEEFEETERFTGEVERGQAQFHEALAALGALVPDVTKPVPAWMARSFYKDGIQSLRSTLASRLRQHCAEVLNTTPANMISSSARRDTHKHLIGWKQPDGEAGHYAHLAVPILHKNNNEDYDPSTVFLNPVLMHVYIAMMTGPATANGIAVAHRAGREPDKEIATSDCLRLKLGITNITPGAIATAATLTHWALGPDEKLQVIGGVTGINWLDVHEQYLQLIMDGLRGRLVTFRQLIREWDEALFPGTETSIVGSSRQQPRLELSNALALMENAEVEEEDQEQDSSAEGVQDGSRAPETDTGSPEAGAHGDPTQKEVDGNDNPEKRVKLNHGNRSDAGKGVKEDGKPLDDRDFEVYTQQRNDTINPGVTEALVATQQRKYGSTSLPSRPPDGILYMLQSECKAHRYLDDNLNSLKNKNGDLYTRIHELEEEIKGLRSRLSRWDRLALETSQKLGAAAESGIQNMENGDTGDTDLEDIDIPVQHSALPAATYRRGQGHPPSREQS
ncbi:hypothetical protein V5O48_015666, partial [Marasmius crinis-equi]